MSESGVWNHGWCLRSHVAVRRKRVTGAPRRASESMLCHVSSGAHLLDMWDISKSKVLTILAVLWSLGVDGSQVGRFTAKSPSEIPVVCEVQRTDHTVLSLGDLSASLPWRSHHIHRSIVHVITFVKTYWCLIHITALIV